MLGAGESPCWAHLLAIPGAEQHPVWHATPRGEPRGLDMRSTAIQEELGVRGGRMPPNRGPGRAGSYATQSPPWCPAGCGAPVPQPTAGRVGVSCLFSEWGHLYATWKVLFFLHFIPTLLLNQENERRKF